ncbi:hypothetical protein KP509_13G068400 [Ceratopteris richardii]|uniref:RING-type E3 ubiquitin transferase n=1 Tax=Ceratopteris richardii TaxID=49495 RepID=A0A8T2TGA7_CERRI|nr:hypothetical protein KP509_13G068400 [Ceratopteris richardii]
MILLEILPISTLLTVLTGEILEAAFAAHDVLMEKETFGSLSAYLCHIVRILEELKNTEIKDIPATEQALKALQRDVRMANGLINMCKKKSRFYQLIHCRHIVKTAQELTRDLGKSLCLLSLANNEVLLDARNNVENLKDQMIHAEYQASQQKLNIIEKIEMGIKEHKTDQSFLNELIKEIASAVGVQVEDSSEVKKVLENIRKEKEEAAELKQRDEEIFMEQIIALLSRADAFRTPEAIREEYRTLRSTVDGSAEIPPLETFHCPLSKKIMKDPVSVATGQVYERANIENWFASGNNTDPVTKKMLPNLDLKPNHKVRECIEEWIDINSCIRLCNVKQKLESGDLTSMDQALDELQELWVSSYKIRHWVAEEQIVAFVVDLLKFGVKGMRQKILRALRGIISDCVANKKQLIDVGGVELVTRFLAKDIAVAKLAAALLVELLHPDLEDMPSVVPLVLERLSQEEFIILLVTLLHSKDIEAAHNAETVLRQLCYRDENIIEMAKANWLTPLIECFSEGSEDLKLKMVGALGDLELTQASMDTLGDNGVVEILTSMVNENLEVKTVALRALQNLIICRANKKRLAKTGAVPLILDNLFSAHLPIIVRNSAAAVMEKLVHTDGSTFLVDANGKKIDSGKVLCGLLGLHELLISPSAFQNHVLSFLQGLVSSSLDSEARKTFSDAQGISLLLPLLEHRASEVRNVTIKVLCCIASDCGLEISSFIMQRRLVPFFVRMLDNKQRGDISAATAGILACLPQDDMALTNALVEENALVSLLNLLTDENPSVKENAMGALLRFTLPSNIDIQRKLINMEIYGALKGLIYSGTEKSKLRAAIAFQNFSLSTMTLSTPIRLHGCCLMIQKTPVSCKVHGGQCAERTTFCLVKAEVIPVLVFLIQNKESESAGAAVDALSTLIAENENLENFAWILHNEKAIGPILNLVSDGTEPSKEKALNLLGKVFKVKMLVENYGGKAKNIFVDLATNGSDPVCKKAAKILASMENMLSSAI